MMEKCCTYMSTKNIATANVFTVKACVQQIKTTAVRCFTSSKNIVLPIKFYGREC